MFGGIGDWFEGLGKGLASGFGSIVDGLGSLGSSIVGGIGDLFSGLFEFLGGLLNSIFEFFKPLIDFIAWIIEFLGGIVSAIGNFIWSLFESAINLIVGGISTIVDWIGSFFKFLGDLLHDLFVPDEDFFDKKISGLQKTLNSHINTSEFENAMTSLQGAQARTIVQPRASFFGINIDFDFMSAINEHKGTIHMFIRAFVYVMLLRYNINNVYKLIRGSDMNSGGTD